MFIITSCILIDLAFKTNLNQTTNTYSIVTKESVIIMTEFNEKHAIAMILTLLTLGTITVHSGISTRVMK